MIDNLLGILSELCYCIYFYYVLIKIYIFIIGQKIAFTWATEWIPAANTEEEAAREAPQFLQPDDGPESPQPEEEPEEDPEEDAQEDDPPEEHASDESENDDHEIQIFQNH